jgi:hypothetical protein
MSPEYGTLCTDPSASIIIDNGAFGAYKRGEEWDESAFYRFLNRQGENLHGVACPDIVCGGLESLNHSACHYDRLSDYPLYLVVQDGMTPDDVLRHLLDYPDYSGLFIGGSVAWKWRTMALWCNFAHSLKLLCHVGRVGSVRGYMVASYNQADSVDGSNLMRNNRLSEILRYRNMEQQQEHLLKKEDWLAHVNAAIAAGRS